jgi:hypothetical protein
MDPLDQVVLAADLVPVLAHRFPWVRRVLTVARPVLVVLLITGGAVALIMWAVNAGQSWGTHALLHAVQAAAAVPLARG